VYISDFRPPIPGLWLYFPAQPCSVPLSQTTPCEIENTQRLRFCEAARCWRLTLAWKAVTRLPARSSMQRGAPKLSGHAATVLGMHLNAVPVLAAVAPASVAVASVAEFAHKNAHTSSLPAAHS
jgi:hypothetical protein